LVDAGTPSSSKGLEFEGMLESMAAKTRKGKNGIDFVVMRHLAASRE
jgi:hypothetical protein